MKSPLFIFSFFILFYSCKKKADPVSQESPPPASTTTSTITPTVTPVVPTDTIKPRSYYPVYPGSWWKYLKNDSVFFTDHTSSAYMFVKYVTQYQFVGNHQVAAYDSVYAPLYNGEPVFGYKRLRFHPFHGGEEHAPDKYAFLTETAGICSMNISTEFCDLHNTLGIIPPDYVYPMEMLVNILKTINAAGDSVIITRGKMFNGCSGAATSKITYREYTKNTGLTFYARVDTLQHDTLEKWKLVDHYIAPH